MNSKNVLVVDNDIASSATWERVVSDNKLKPQLIIGLEEVEPVLKGYDKNLARVELSPENFPAVALVADTLGGILTPVDEIMRVLHTRHVCCIATTITKRQTLASADFGINRLNIASWAQKWLLAIQNLAAHQKATGSADVLSKRKILVINHNIDFCLSMIQILKSNNYPCLEPLTRVTRLENGVITGHNTSRQEVEIGFEELAVLFVDASTKDDSADNPASVKSKEIAQGAKVADVCCVTTSHNQFRILPEADFMIDEGQRRKFIELWMKAIYPIACKTVRNG